MQTNTNKSYTISILKANRIAVTMILPLGLVLGLPYIIIHGWELVSFNELSIGRAALGTSKFLLAVLVGIPIHELLHGLGWAIFARHGFKSISFGIKWEYFTPYCHCKEPLRKLHFVVGAILPLIILGIVPVFISYLTGSFKTWFYGFFFTIAAGGDIIALWMLRKVKKDLLVQDHPSELGFIVIVPDK